MSTIALAFPDKPLPGEPPSSRLLTIAQVCDHLSVSRSTFYDWRQARKAPSCVRLPNGQLRVSDGDLQEWVDKHRDES